MSGLVFDDVELFVDFVAKPGAIQWMGFVGEFAILYASGSDSIGDSCFECDEYCPTNSVLLFL